MSEAGSASGIELTFWRHYMELISTSWERNEFHLAGPTARFILLFHDGSRTNF
jgi:hypothetical protein